MDVLKAQKVDDVRAAYESPNVSILMFPATDVIRTSDPDAGKEYPETWGQ